jgi:outer membrane protein OmpA-like peptidoglycan-associated protein
MKRVCIFLTFGLVFACLALSLSANPAAGSSAQTAAPAPQSSAQPDFKVLKDDFIPGEKTLFYDDFSDMAPDEAPPHWKVHGNSLALKQAGEIRQLTADGEADMTPLLTNFPQNFTIEAEIKFESDGSRWNWYFYPKGSGDSALSLSTRSFGEGDVTVWVRTGQEDLVDRHLPVDWSQPIKQAIWVQNGRVRVYVNGQKVVDANHVDLPPLASAELGINDSLPEGSVSIRTVRIAESTPDFSRSIASSGRYVTHGILFDTDSDRIKPESGPVIKSIAAGLAADPALKLRIEGHTDSTGTAEHNLDLSKRRAEAVKAVLVSQFGIDAARLTTDGLGATKPIATNDTPQGRAQNRRVEFVRQ